MALPAVADLFKGSIDDSLKKLVQPAAIVPATVFVLLNIVLIFPALSGAGPAVAAFADLDNAWKAVLIVALILVFGYVLLNLSGSIMRLATGELLQGTPLADLMTRRWQRRIRRLAQRAKQYREGNPRLLLHITAEESRLPPANAAAPTRFGNILAGTSHSLAVRYGFDLSATWVHLAQLLAEDKEKLAVAVEDERTGIQVLLNLATVVGIFGFEGAILTLVTRDPAGAIYLLAALPLVYGLYRSACARALSYVDLVEAAVDLHRSLLADKLGLDIDDPGKEGAWNEIAQWFLSDRNPTAPDLTAVLGVTTVVPDNILVKACQRGGHGRRMIRSSWQVAPRQYGPSTTGFSFPQSRLVVAATRTLSPRWFYQLESHGDGAPLHKSESVGRGWGRNCSVVEPSETPCSFA